MEKKKDNIRTAKLYAMNLKKCTKGVILTALLAFKVISICFTDLI